MQRKTALVLGASGFIGHWMVRFLHEKGYWVRGVDNKEPQFPTEADEFMFLDLRIRENTEEALRIPDGFDEVYNFAADMGGMGFIEKAEFQILINNNLINNNVLTAAISRKAKKYFFASSACVYPDMNKRQTPFTEEDSYPAEPHNEYGWEKLFAERMILTANRHFTNVTFRIGRLQNTYGPECTYKGGREKAPAAICRKIIEAQPNGSIEVWGSGRAERTYTYIEDTIDGIYRVMHGPWHLPINIGEPRYKTVKELVEIISEYVAEKPVKIKWVPGPIGVYARRFDNTLIDSLGWEPETDYIDGLTETYNWIKEQIDEV